MSKFIEGDGCLKFCFEFCYLSFAAFCQKAEARDYLVFQCRLKQL